MKKIIRLFDVDGVLIQHNAYKKCVAHTVEYVLDGKPKLNLNEIIKKSESKGIHDVWDITAIIIAFSLEKKYNELERFLEEENLGYDTFDKVIHFLKPSEKIIEQYLTNAREIENRAVSLFQQFLLGKEKFIQTYGLEPEIISNEPILEKEDKALITQESLERLTKQNDNYCIYTARPGLPPEGETLKYSPEAEIALNMTGMESYPLVSMGSMQWLAQQKGGNTVNFVKPYPHQLIAALFASVGDPIKDALLKSYNLCNGGKEPELVGRFLDSKVYIFEDTPSGLDPIRVINNIFSKQEVHTEFVPVGISQQKGPKYDGLTKICGENVFPDINKAIEFTCKK